MNWDNEKILLAFLIIIIIGFLIIQSTHQNENVKVDNIQESKLDSTSLSIKNISSKIDVVNTKFKEIDDKIEVQKNDVNTKFKEIEDKIEVQKNDVNTKFKEIDDKIEVQKNDVNTKFKEIGDKIFTKEIQLTLDDVNWIAKIINGQLCIIDNLNNQYCIGDPIRS